MSKEKKLSTHMLAEAREAPQAVARQLSHDAAQYREFGAQLRTQQPSSILTIARGSSDHAAHFMSYLIMARMGRLVTSLPMSLITLYQSRMVCEGLLSMQVEAHAQQPMSMPMIRHWPRRRSGFSPCMPALSKVWLPPKVSLHS